MFQIIQHPSTQFSHTAFGDPFGYRVGYNPFRQMSMFTPDFFEPALTLHQSHPKLRARRNRARLIEAKQRVLRRIEAEHALAEREEALNERSPFKELFREFQNNLSTSMDHEERPANSRSNRTFYTYKNDGRNTFSTKTRNITDEKGNKKTYVEESKNGKVLRKRQRHLLPGSKDASVLTRFGAGVENEEAFASAWSESGLRPSDPFKVSSKNRLEADPALAKQDGRDATEKAGTPESPPNPASPKISADAMEVESPQDDFIVVEEPAKVKEVEKVIRTPSPPNTMPEGWMEPVEGEH
ncbi:hypothetical protein TrVE_jg9337 [Triparma verrucosa]|uniref:Uncharacterized protein n=1 Tax=Triparma verrucosa TaxID=1606542 RepID=A0A9W6Z2H7_9STRA|nr:hypothetical protein TrVE_jg9337 [Triparma verrucosa]